VLCGCVQKKQELKLHVHF